MAEQSREWQVECVDAIRTAWATGRKDFLVEACPGAGKTRLALSVVKAALEAGRCGRVIVIVPSAHLKVQWARVAETMGVRLSRKSSNEELARGLPSDVDGYVATYAAVSGFATVHAHRASEKPTLLVVDEIHHAGVGRGWGDALKEAFEQAAFRLALSGTPFRGDNQPIPFVQYDAQGLSVPDFRYGYGDAVRDSVCRPVCFPTWQGQAEWAYDGEARCASFEDDLDRADESRRLRAILTPKGEFVASMITHAHERLDHMRRGDHAEAGGLVLADDMANARAISEVMRRKIGVEPILAVSDDVDASRKIQEFSKGRTPWLVAVRMVSEGVDIPRLRVGVYATCTIAL